MNDEDQIYALVRAWLQEQSDEAYCFIGFDPSGNVDVDGHLDIRDLTKRLVEKLNAA